MKQRSRVQGNILQVDYDFVLSRSDEECCFSLSRKEVAMLLSSTEYFAWPTRWFSEENTPIDSEIIQTLKDTLEYKLMSGCCPDEGIIHRYTSEGIYESSNDGGANWYPDPDNDPRNDWVSAPPLPGENSDAKKCAAADNVTAQFNIWADDLIELLSAGTLITAIAAAIVGFIASVVFASGVGAAWGVLLFSLAAALFSEGSSGFAAAMTSGVYEEFKCILYCNMGSDGTFSEENIIEILDQITEKFDGIVEAFFYSIVSTMRSVGMSNTATLGGSTADDCGDCDCSPACIDPDFIMHGNLIAQTANSIDIQAVMTTYNGLTAYWAVYGSLEMDWCCYYCSFAVQSGSIDSGSLYDCVTGGAAGGAGLKRRIEFYSNSSPFVIRYNFDIDGTDCT